MSVRYVGRQPTQKGKSLYEICQQLNNSGVGRVVYRTRYVNYWPTQKSFFRLTKVIPDKTSQDFRKGTAWGQKVFRGNDYGEVQIGSGHKSDWNLLPKDEEQEFCQITEKATISTETPSHIDVPPWLNLLIKREKSIEAVEIPLLTKKKLLPLNVDNTSSR